MYTVQRVKQSAEELKDHPRILLIVLKKKKKKLKTTNALAYALRMIAR